jgi:hypothetical protein
MAITRADASAVSIRSGDEQLRALGWKPVKIG